MLLMSYHSWYMGVVSNSYGRFCGAWLAVDIGKHAGKSQDVLVACRKMPGHFRSAK